MHLHFSRLSAYILACALLAPVVARAQVYLHSGHIDLNVGYDAPAEGFGFYARHTDPEAGGALVNEPTAHAAFFVSDTGGRYAGAGGLLPFLGQSGQPVWLVPQNNPPATIPWIGFGGYGLGETDFDAFDPRPELTGNTTTPAVRIALLRVTAPAGADFALWQTDAVGAAQLLFSNRPATSAPQAFGLRRGQHAHFNWGFSAPGFYRLHLRIDATSGGLPVAPRNFTVDFAISVLPGYEQWRRAGPRFTAAERRDRAIGGPDADPEADGLPNLLEYALVGEPRLADAPALAPSPGLAAATPSLRFQRIADPLLIYTVEASDDLVVWTPFWTSTGAQNVSGPVEVPAPAPLSPAAPRSFLRLRVNHVD